ncbi:MAG TPA: hypothetical protein VFK05_39675 [Polyangiaceae bacterium]|nr:hypothetical protein [Polyangiaceae bacterium]
MLTDPIRLLVLLSGLQFLQLPGMIVGQRVLAWRDDLSKLTPVSRRLVVALGIGIVVYVCGTGVIGLLYPRAAITSEVGRALCLLQAFAWTTRASLQLLVIGPTWPRHARWLNRSLSCIYSALALGFAIICGQFLAAQPPL